MGTPFSREGWLSTPDKISSSVSACPEIVTMTAFR
jgi:hypothetical protein